MAVSNKSSNGTAVEQAKDRLAGRGLGRPHQQRGHHVRHPGRYCRYGHLLEVIKANVETVQNVTFAFLPLLKEGSQKKVFNL